MRVFDLQNATVRESVIHAKGSVIRLYETDAAVNYEAPSMNSESETERRDGMRRQ